MEAIVSQARKVVDFFEHGEIVSDSWVPDVSEAKEYWTGLGVSRRFVADLVLHGPGFILLEDVRRRLRADDMRGLTAGPSNRWRRCFPQHPYPFERRWSPQGEGYEINAALVDVFREAARDGLLGRSLPGGQWA